MRYKSNFEKKFVQNNPELAQNAKKVVETKAGNQLDEKCYQEKYGQDIFDIQKQKALIMERLKQERELINKDEQINGHGKINRAVSYKSTADESFFVVENGDKMEKASLGDLLTDLSYGIEHNIDSSQVPKNILREYIRQKAKIELGELFDLQLLSSDIERVKERNPRFAAFLEKQKKEKKKSYNQPTGYDYMENKSGLIFEKELSAMLKELEVDLPELELELIKPDVLTDIHRKIDFIIRLKSHKRGVYVEKDEANIEPSDKIFGIQLTINTKPGKLWQKQAQVTKSKRQGFHKLNDLLLITIPRATQKIIKNYRNWKKMGKSTGGPARVYDAQTKLKILEQLLKGIGQGELIKNNKDKILAYYNSKIQKNKNFKDTESNQQRVA